jgi:hypothetical protein
VMLKLIIGLLRPTHRFASAHHRPRHLRR